MDNNSESIDDFELVLKRQCAKKPPTVYKSEKYSNNSIQLLNQKLSAQQVISSVAKQIKVIQSSELAMTERKPSICMDNYKTSTFLPLNKLQDSMFQNPEPNSFDTQLISETQLVHIAQDAEAGDMNNGMTQEFETTFNYPQKSSDLHYNQNTASNSTSFPILDISLKKPDRKFNFSPIEHENIKDCTSPMISDENFDIIEEIDTGIDIDIETYHNLNDCMEIDDIDELDATVQDLYQLDHLTVLSQQNLTQKPPSPVFNIKSKNLRSNTPLIFDLVAFENFAKIAMPVVEETADNKEAKFLIKSQIIRKEMFTHAYKEQTDVQSPIIEYNSGSLRLNKESIAKICKKLDFHDNKVTKIKHFDGIEQNKSIDGCGSDKTSLCSFKDEILFSSDEEEGCQQHCYNDLPFTCALETSFYESKDVLDKTMYVGFQTASNKSITIETASFCKAKSFIDSIDKSSDNLTLKDIVEMCENNTTNLEVEDKVQTTHDADTLTAGYCTKKDLKIENEIDGCENASVNSLEENGNERLGFRTASNNHIQLSEKSFDICKRVFEGIDLVENFQTISVVKSKKEAMSRNFEAVQSIDGDIIEEFQDDLMQTELEDILKNIENGNELLIENTLNLNQEPKVLFKTASNKNIRISDTALAKSKDVFHDIGFEEDINNTFKQSNSNENVFNYVQKSIGFKTASNKSIPISEEALTKTKNIFDNLNDGDDSIRRFRDLNKNYKVSNIDMTQLNKKNKPAIIETESKHIKPLLSQETNNKPERLTAKPTSVLEKLNKELTGFKTASNKDLYISTESLAKGKGMFIDIELKDDKIFNDDEEPPFFGFERDDNFIENVQETLVKSQKIIEKLTQSTSNTSTFAYKNDSEKRFKGFQTASNKQISISENALAKSRQLLQDLAENENTKDNSMKEVDLKFNDLRKASSTKAIKEALVRGSKIFQENPNKDKDSLEIETSLNKSTHSTNSLFQGFQTASNKAVKISEASSAKSRKIFQDITDDEPFPNNFKKTKATSSFSGFKTASNKEVIVSAAALDRSKKILRDLNEDVLIKSNTESLIKTSSNQKAGFRFQGFHTASNKEIKISADALARSKNMLRELDEECININNLDTGVRASPNSRGFQTASKKEVKVSANALAKSRKIFQDFNEASLQFRNQDTVHTKPAYFKGFQTASKKDVKISAEALARSRKLFQDIDEIETNNHKTDLDSEANNGLKFIGFQTANNKTVQVSKEAVANSRKIFRNLDSNPDRNSEASSKVDFESNLKNTGFKTANNDKVEISNEALIKSKKVFAVDTDSDMKQHTKITPETKYVKNICRTIDDIDTQLMNNFDHSMHEKTPKRSKRSGSPILSCPKSKKRKVFQIPYSQKSPKKLSESNFKPPQVQKPENENMFKFKVDYKKTKVYSLNDLKNLENESTEQIEIDPYIRQFDFESLQQFEFSDSRNDITQSVMSLTELKQIFLESVNEKLVPEGWLDIQLKLILWKLISYEVRFPKTMHLICKAKNVMEQLKYRYDRELFNAERPALRKIFERDDVASKTLVLCVVAVLDAQDTSQPPELLLTDGWYVIQCVIDKYLARLVGGGRITVGCKLVTHGAELVGLEQAVSPWEDTSSIRLKIFGNSTRRGLWDARLGYHGDAAILSRLSNVTQDGGKVSKLRVLITRVYPALYVDKFEDGSTVTRSERLEHLYQIKYESERQAVVEKIYEEVEKEVLDQDSQECEEIECGFKRKRTGRMKQINKIFKNDGDPEFTSHLTLTQTAHLEQKTALEREKLLQEIQARVTSKMASLGVALNRNVVTLHKVRVASVEEKMVDGEISTEVTIALLSIWRPNEAVVELIKEGSWIEILNTVPTAMRYGELQISAGRQSIFSQSKYQENEKVKDIVSTLKRTCHPIKDIVKYPAMTTDYNEIDTVGIVFEIDPTIQKFDSNKHQFQNVYLADIDKNIISINFWGGLKKFGFENVLDTGQTVACTNLQKRAGNSRKNIPQYRVTEFSYFTKTPKSDTARKIIEDLEQNLRKIDKNTFCQECTSLRSNFSVKQQTNENVTPYRFPNVDFNLFKNRIFLDSPVAQSCNKKDEINLSGLDFDSTFKQTDTQEMSPRTLLRKRQVQERIAKLKRYGEPPPLSPVQIINKSKNAANPFKSPIVSKSDVSLSVANSEKNLPKREETLSECEIQYSPVINLNRTYVKRSNPVKLDFSKNDNSVSETVDDFAEDFDCSPPLSLD